MPGPEPVTPRRSKSPRGQGGALREVLLKEATDLIDELGGTGALSIRAVTRRAGVSPMALYLHFADRDDLVRAVVERGFARFVAALEETSHADGQPRDRMQAMAEAYLDFARRQPAFYGVIFGRAWTEASSHADGRPRGATDIPSSRAAFNLLMDGVAHCLPPGRRERDARRAALGIWTGLHGFITLATTRPALTWPADDEFARDLLDRWLRG